MLDNISYRDIWCIARRYYAMTPICAATKTTDSGSLAVRGPKRGDAQMRILDDIEIERLVREAFPGKRAFSAGTRSDLDPAGRRIRSWRSRPVPRSPVRGFSFEGSPTYVSAYPASEPPLSSGCSAAGGLRRHTPPPTVNTRGLLRTDMDAMARRSTSRRRAPVRRGAGYASTRDAIAQAPGSARSVRYWRTCSCMSTSPNLEL